MSEHNESIENDGNGIELYENEPTTQKLVGVCEVFFDKEDLADLGLMKFGEALEYAFTLYRSYYGDQFDVEGQNSDEHFEKILIEKGILEKSE
jgi:hypothetical protein